MDGDASAFTSTTAIARRLAVSSSAARGRAVRALVSWLPSQPNDAISDDDLHGLWNGLFYAVWHANKPSALLRITDRLAALFADLQMPLACRYFDAFVFTMRREWPCIDSMRLDKFDILIRKLIGRLLVRMKDSVLDVEVLSEILDFALDGFSYRVVEVFLDEMKEVLPLAVDVSEWMLKPFLRVLEKSGDKGFVNKVKVCVFERIIESGRKMLSLALAGEPVDLGSEVEKLGKLCIVLGLSKKFLDAAFDSETYQTNRKLLLCLHEDFLTLENDLDKSGVELVNSLRENGNLGNVGGNEVSNIAEQVESWIDGVELENADKENGSDVSSSSDKPSNSSAEISLIHVSSEINGIHRDEFVINAHDSISCSGGSSSNLSEQFEKSGSEAGDVMKEDEISCHEMVTSVASAAMRKRKRTISIINGASTSKNNSKESVKKVRFSMKSNLVWKPHNPMPPQSLRLPPSATPRGSALKKGVPPGPVRESPISIVERRKKKARSVKKSKKGLKNTAAVKRLKKIQVFLSETGN